jgi:hypothetical protein
LIRSHEFPPPTIKPNKLLATPTKQWQQQQDYERQAYPAVIGQVNDDGHVLDVRKPRLQIPTGMPG